jgi:phosphoglucomutase
MDVKIRSKFENWSKSEYIDIEDREELLKIKDNDKEVEERFYTDLAFGTGGMRGIRGIGTNRINKYMVKKAAQGIADYMLKMNAKEAKERGVVIAYDCRIGSYEYSLNMALVFAGNGIKANLFESLRSTPELSFAVRELGTLVGVMVTASHNPKEYNGFKVYWEDGGQVVEPHATDIVNAVYAVESFDEIKYLTQEEAEEKGLLKIVGEEVDDRYIEEIKKEAINTEIPGKKDFKIVYSPLHGTGRRPLQRVMKEMGFENVFTVAEQEEPDGTFPTCDYANPEDPAVFKLGIELAEKIGSKICMANDPDADRIGIAVKRKSGEWVYPNGNQVGLLLMNYILENKKDIPKNGAVISTVVSTPMLDVMAAEKGVNMFRTLTGFKYIGEKILEFETGKIDGSYVFGFEESYGYLIGTHARDKDAIVSTMLIAEMAAYYESQGTSVMEELEKLYDKYGWYKEGIQAITMSGKEGAEKIQNIMKSLRENMPSEIIGKKVKIVKDFELQKEYDKISGKECSTGLPKSNVLQMILEDDTYITARPSGTEPKIKYYYGINAKTEVEAEKKLEDTMKGFSEFLEK